MKNIKRPFRREGLNEVPDRRVSSSLASPLREVVDVYDEEPDYGGFNEPKGYIHVRGFVEAAFSLKKGLRIEEIHKVSRCESDFQFIFTEKPPPCASSEDYCSAALYDNERIQQAAKGLSELLGKAYPKEISFRFSDITILNTGGGDSQ